MAKAFPASSIQRWVRTPPSASMFIVAALQYLFVDMQKFVTFFMAIICSARVVRTVLLFKPSVTLTNNSFLSSSSKSSWLTQKATLLYVAEAKYATKPWNCSALDERLDL